MEEVLREYVSGVYVRKNNEGFHLKINDPEFDIVYNESPLVLLDGIPVFDANGIIALDPLKIKKIEVVRHAFIKGYLDCYGIVSLSF